MTHLTIIKKNFYRVRYFQVGILNSFLILLGSFMYSGWLILSLPLNFIICFKFGWRSVVNSCVQIQKEIINKHKPDILIGSSFGGGIALQLIKRKIWNGPTILLAPAGGLMSRKLLQWDLQDIEPSILKDMLVVIVHGKNDDIVPIEDSYSLREKYNEIKIVEVEGDHRLHEYCRDCLCDLIRDMYKLNKRI